LRGLRVHPAAAGELPGAVAGARLSATGAADLGGRRGLVRGALAQRGVLVFGEASDFIWQIMRLALNGRAVRRYFTEVLRQATILATGSALIVIALCLAFGLTDGILASYFARQVGAPSASGAGTAIGNLRELTPYAFGYMMAAKV